MTAEESVESEKEPVVGYVHTKEMPRFLSELGISLVVTTYQAQRILLFTPKGDRLNMLMRVFERPTGIYVSRSRIALCCKNQILVFHNVGSIHDLEGNTLPYDACFVPRRAHITGDISAHEVVWDNNELLIINTRFSCLCRLSEDWSFVPGWRPPFISEYAPEDRCHLNGIAVDNSGPRYVTVLGESDVKEGWRENKASGGCIVDVKSGKIISRGLSMPHSPRLYAGALWVLDSGTGSLQVVDQKSGERRTVVSLPGYLRGLCFVNRFAFIGLSKTREKKIFGGVPLENMHPEFLCAVYVVDITNGQIVGFIHFTKGIEELFSVEVLSGFASPYIVGLQDNQIDGVYVFPPSPKSQ